MFKTDGSYLHILEVDETEALPDLFTYPFYYEPHPLCIKASLEIQDYLVSQKEFEHNFGLDDIKSGLPIGKMFGVMVVEDRHSNIFYLAGFSGKLAESNFITGFVPPIYDTLNPSGFYKKGEAELNRINAEIDALEHSPQYINAKAKYEDLKFQFEEALLEFKALQKREKVARDKARFEGQLHLNSTQYKQLLEELKKQSIYYHFRLRDLKSDWQKKIDWQKKVLSGFEEEINQLRKKRRVKSAKLQKAIHDQYQFLNFRGENRDLNSIFESTQLGQPPAGAGECVAPKLFQFAYQNKLKPIAMAEFWWGASPKSEVRRHKQFYPSCRGKCEPILGHMMKGLEVEPNPMEKVPNEHTKLEIIYEDDFLLLVNKPHEFLSVPGKTIKDSVQTRMKTYLPEAKGPLLVHRLDMSTSGLLLVAKNEKTHKNLQKQFIERSVKKRYIALLDGVIDKSEGYIELPLRVDLNNRPRQLVCYAHGKPGKTKYRVLALEKNRTRVHFYPITGRTHQLRVHAAHHKGLDMPIVGDDLYGKKAERLYLHAEQLTFEHPVTKERLTFTSEPSF
ncbi:RluA family pseudouridine synthase [Winogradskyella alexanderae]|uniref:RNA pseudouridine synthase n=1 Tax=Winogradskyella alexanderae TaxID=2877123 RepID=A0ABS7XSW0_9FLAO|nr:RluA family pseudouridine synthase [Winogradskyella alexanderae]MCA0133114.1 RNA pseudouridine synthase [Winogradskyella alexanderae]